VKGVNRKWTDNTMGKRKKTGQTIQWGNEKRQDRQYNGETKKTGQTIQWGNKKKQDRQYNGETKKDKWTNNDQQNTVSAPLVTLITLVINLVKSRE
jgi:hypothetical protein